MCWRGGVVGKENSSSRVLRGWGLCAPMRGEKVDIRDRWTGISRWRLCHAVAGGIPLIQPVGWRGCELSCGWGDVGVSIVGRDVAASEGLGMPAVVKPEKTCLILWIHHCCNSLDENFHRQTSSMMWPKHLSGNGASSGFKYWQAWVPNPAMSRELTGVSWRLEGC